MKDQGIIDRIVPEPFGGAHQNWDEAVESLKRCIVEAIAELKDLDPTVLVSQRIDKFSSMACFEE